MSFDCGLHRVQLCEKAPGLDRPRPGSVHRTFLLQIANCGSGIATLLSYGLLHRSLGNTPHEAGDKTHTPTLDLEMSMLKNIPLLTGILAGLHMIRASGIHTSLTRLFEQIAQGPLTNARSIVASPILNSKMRLAGLPAGREMTERR
jgi:hypothetical protein